MNATDKKYDNDWYFWGLENVGGRQGGMYKSFASKTRTTEMSARSYINWLKVVTGRYTGGTAVWEYNDRMDAIKTMEKWLVLWNEKRAIEIPIELEAKRIEDIRIAEQKRLQDIEDARVREEQRAKELQNDISILAEVRSGSFKVSEERLLQLLSQEKIQNVTFNEQKNSGDFNETPITDISLNGGCSECTEPEHQMPDGSMMKDSEMKKSNVGIAGIAGFAIIGLLLYSKGGLK